MMKTPGITLSMALATAGFLAAAGAFRTEGQDEGGRALASLVEAERAFSRMSEEKGIREAFLTWLAPDSVVFRPEPVPGRPIYEKMNAAEVTVLTWEPEAAEIASSGELGYTTGPYRTGTRRDAEPTGFGHYVSVWKKQPDGTWKVFLDIGVPHGPPDSARAGIEFGPPQTDIPPLSPEALRDAEFAFGRRAGSFESRVGSKGLRKALEEFATDDIRVYRPGRLPVVGRTGLKEIVPEDDGRVSPGAGSGRSAYQVIVAWSGDLAASYGTFETRKSRSAVETTAYLRIWRRRMAEEWRICLDIEIPTAKGKMG